MNIEMSQPMSFKRSLQVSTYEFWQRHGSAMRTMMKPGSMMNLARVRARARARVRIRVRVRGRGRGKGRVGLGLGVGLGLCQGSD